MLSIGEAHNMGFNGRGGFHHNVYDRGSYGLLDGSNGNNAGGLNDFLHHNPFLPQYPSSQSMEFQPDSLLFDVEVLPQVSDDHFDFPVGIVTTLPPPTTTFGLVPQPPMQRESWMELSGRGVKRECPVQLQQQQQQQPARKKLDVATEKCKRPSDQADHILRERQRRDDMTSKFAVLDSLLPTAPKRDRSTIVDDSIEYVKNLHHRIKLLQKRKEELVASPKRSKWPKAEVLQQQQQQQPASPNSNKNRKPPVSLEETNRIRAVLRASLESIHVHTDMPNQVVINMVCRPQPRLQSNILQCLESLYLDVLQCSITKVSHRLICVITAKPQEATTPTSGIVAALKYAMGSDIRAD